MKFDASRLGFLSIVGSEFYYSYYKFRIALGVALKKPIGLFTVEQTLNASKSHGKTL